MKRKGTAVIHATVHVGSEAAARLLGDRLYHRSRAAGTVTNFSYGIERVGPHDWSFTAAWHHTCINEGAARSDALRAIRQVFTGTSHRWQADVKRTSWKEVTE